MGKKVFLDLKYHDIPNTVSKTARIVAELGVFMFNIHTFGGFDLINELGVGHRMATQVKHLAGLALKAGLDGVVASPQEIETVRNCCGQGFIIMSPGIRPSWASLDDQKRTMTPKEALRKGADYIVTGRAILSQPNPMKALHRIAEEIENV
jgi:orotidine-5'-phosphate decarboxylase